MTAVTIHTNIVSNEVKGNWAPLEPPGGKKRNGLFGQPSACFFIPLTVYDEFILVSLTQLASAGTSICGPGQKFKDSQVRAAWFPVCGL